MKHETIHLVVPVTIHYGRPRDRRGVIHEAKEMLTTHRRGGVGDVTYDIEAPQSTSTIKLAPAPATWQLMATAPKDGTEVLVRQGKVCYLACYGVYGWNTDKAWYVPLVSDPDGTHLTLRPTHWMPIPPP